MNTRDSRMSKSVSEVCVRLRVNVWKIQKSKENTKSQINNRLCYLTHFTTIMKSNMIT